MGADDCVALEEERGRLWSSSWDWSITSFNEFTISFVCINIFQFQSNILLEEDFRFVDSQKHITNCNAIT